jgi:hypothetical protein
LCKLFGFDLMGGHGKFEMVIAVSELFDHSD